MAEVKYKEILHVFCSRNKLQQPSYTCEDEEGSFYCEVRKCVVFCISFFRATLSCAWRELSLLDVEKQRARRKHRSLLLKPSASIW